MKPLLTAISSHRPHNESGTYATNQMLALRSWLPVFEQVVYVGDEEADLKSHRVRFVPGLPVIRQMAALAAQATTPLAAIVNADIIIGKHMIQVAELMIARNVKAGTSRRWTFNIGEDYGTHSKLVDMGFDVFVATKPVWEAIARDIPESYKLGHILWDTWVLGYLNRNFGRGLRDFTNYKCVYHPNHGDRKPSEGMPMNSSYLRYAALPAAKL